MKTMKKRLIIPKKRVPELFSDEKKNSGFNITKMYSDIVTRLFPLYHKSTEGSFFKTIDIVLQYLSDIEKTELHIQNHDLYIKFKLELIKTERLPLFSGYSVRDIDTQYKDYQYVRLILKNLGMLFLDLSDQVVLTPSVKGCRTLLHLEKVYIENAAKSINMVNPKGEFEQDEIIDYFSSFNTLSSYFSAIVGETSFSEKTTAILRKIENSNSELNVLIYEKFGVKKSASQWNMTYEEFNPHISKAALYV